MDTCSVTLDESLPLSELQIIDLRNVGVKLSLKVVIVKF